MDKKNMRRHYFIDKRFQTRFILKFCAIVITSSLLIGVLVFFLARGSTTVAIENTEVLVKGTADFILPILVETVLVALLFSGIAVLILTLLASHKISGPLYRLKREIDALSSADFRRNFGIRADDQVQELAKSLDSMCVCLREEHSRLKERYKVLTDYLNETNFHISDNNREGFLAILKGLKEDLDNFKV